jgi:hypothetical protein
MIAKPVAELDPAAAATAQPRATSPQRSAYTEMMSMVDAPEMVSIPRAELDALHAELRRLRREVGRGVARARMDADPGPADEAPAFTRSQLAEAWGICE